MPASELFSDNLLKHVLVEREIGDELLQFAVLGLELPKAAQLRGADPAVLLLPVVERGLTDAHLAADLFDLRACLGLVQRKGDLRFGELRCLHGNRFIFLKIVDRPIF